MSALCHDTPKTHLVLTFSEIRVLFQFVVLNSAAGTGPELRWLERIPDKDEVGGSSPPGPTVIKSGAAAFFQLWGYSAAGSASPWHGEGQGFESP